MGYRRLVLDVRTLLVVVASLLVWGLAAAPAFAQATAGDVNLQYVDCSQVQSAVAQQYNSGDAISDPDAVAGNNSSAANAEAVAEIAQELDISQDQVNACLGSANGGTNPPESTTPESTTTESTTTQESDTSNPDNVMKKTLSSSELPNTGGAPLPGALFGLAMVATGILSAGLIVRRGR